MISVPAYKPAMRYQDHKNEILCNLFHQILFYQKQISIHAKKNIHPLLPLLWHSHLQGFKASIISNGWISSISVNRILANCILSCICTSRSPPNTRYLTNKTWSRNSNKPYFQISEMIYQKLSPTLV